MSTKSDCSPDGPAVNSKCDESGRRQLLTGIALHRLLPDAPSAVGKGYESQGDKRYVAKTLVDCGGGDVLDLSIGITAAASIAGYNTALIEPLGYAAPGVAGDLDGYAVDANRTSYYYVEPAARTSIGEATDDIRERNTQTTPF